MAARPAQAARCCIDSGFFGRILSVRGEFGYWVFEGDWQPAQRPSWNYRKEDGGGIILDMLCHWRYVLDNLFGEVKACRCLGATHIPKRWDENGKPYAATPTTPPTRPSSSTGGVIAHINSSWCTRVRRDDLVTFQVDGTHGSAVAGLHALLEPGARSTRRGRCGIPTCRRPIDFFDELAGGAGRTSPTTTASRRSGSCSSGTSCEDAPFRWDLLEGAKGVQLAELGLKSWTERRWIDVPAAGGAEAMRDDQPADRRRAARALHATQAAAQFARARRRAPFNRVAFAAAHVVADPLADIDPWLDARDRLGRTIAFRRHLWSSASASPRRWTPRSAAWGSTGRPRSS